MLVALSIASLLASYRLQFYSACLGVRSAFISVCSIWDYQEEGLGFVSRKEGSNGGTTGTTNIGTGSEEEVREGRKEGSGKSSEV